MDKTKKTGFKLIVGCIVFMISIFLSPSFSCAENNFYYIQVASFRLEQNAVRFAQKLHRINITAVIRGEDLSDIGYWYRAYIGPFSTWNKADLKRLELRKKGVFFDIAIIHKMQSLVLSNLKERVKPAEKILSEKRIEPAPKIVSEKRPEPADKVVSAYPEKIDDQVSSISQPVHLSETVSRTRLKPTNEITKIAAGRNVSKGNLAIGIKHTYREVQTKLYKRKRIESDGATTTTTSVSVESGIKNELPTLMHIDTIRIRYGLTDYLEIFADLGSAYDELSDQEFVFGGGVRANLVTISEGRFKGFYTAIQEEYLRGKLEEDYKASNGNKWKKEAEWQEFATKVELGLVRSRYTSYIGGVYYIYREDTERRLLENLPSSLTSYIFQDELEEENSFGIFGGVEIKFTPAVFVNLEGQLNTQKSIFGTIEYHF